MVLRALLSVSASPAMGSLYVAYEFNGDFTHAVIARYKDTQVTDVINVSRTCQHTAQQTRDINDCLERPLSTHSTKE